MTNLRIGHGYDVHRLTEGRRLVLGGVDIPWDRGLLGHSDADVLTHAVMDALCGAARLGDIGRLFPGQRSPPTPGISSLALLRPGGGAAESGRLDGGEHRRHPHRPGPQGGPLPPGRWRRIWPPPWGWRRTG